MRKHVHSEKALKTYGWAVISGMIFFGSGLLAGAEFCPLLVGTGTAVALKTPFYWLWEHAFAALRRRSHAHLLKAGFVIGGFTSAPGRPIFPRRKKGRQQ